MPFTSSTRTVALLTRANNPAPTHPLKSIAALVVAQTLVGDATSFDTPERGDIPGDRFPPELDWRPFSGLELCNNARPNSRRRDKIRANPLFTNKAAKPLSRIRRATAKTNLKRAGCSQMYLSAKRNTL